MQLSALFLIVCNSASFEGMSGWLASPNYPGRYGNNMDCRYSISLSEGHYVAITFSTFATEGCCDYVNVCFVTLSPIVRFLLCDRQVFPLYQYLKFHVVGITVSLHHVSVYLPQVYDTKSGILLRTLRGILTYTTVIGLSNQMNLLFHTNGGSTDVGWNATWTRCKFILTCGVTFPLQNNLFVVVSVESQSIQK